MAVPKRKTTRAKRNIRRIHDALKNPALTTDQTTGEIHRRHHITPDGYYRGKQVIIFPEENTSDSEE